MSSPLTRLTWLLAVALAFALPARAQDRAEPTALPLSLLDSAPITISGHFEAPSRPMAVELATRSIGEQIDQKRAAAATEDPLDQLWHNSFLRFIPIAQGDHPEAFTSPTVQDDDPFFTPAYLTVAGKQLDYQLRLSEKRAQILFAP